MSSDPLPSAIDRVLITGGTSYLGRRLTKRLLDQGTAVHIVVRPGSDRSRLDNLPGTTASPTFHEHDGSMESMQNILEATTPSSVFHMATQYLRDHTPAQIPELITNNILFGTQLMEAMRIVGSKRLVSLGTFFQFHDSESYKPTNLYAATKQAFEDIAAYYRAAHDFRTTSLILYDVYGPGDWRTKLMAAIRDAQAANKALNLVPADTVMDLVFVEDVVDALVHTVVNDIEGGPFAVRSAAQTTLQEVVKVFEQENGATINAKFGVYPVPAHTPSPPWQGPMLPGWQPKTDLSEGVRRFLAGEK